jgi:hypothetical protein
MLSQIEAPQTPAVIVNTDTPPTTVSINVTPDQANTTIAFRVTSGSGVTVGPPNTLSVSPGTYNLVFNLQSTTLQFDNPALIVSTPFGSLTESPDSSLMSVTLPDTNNLIKGDGDQAFSFSFLISGQVYDPTIVNDPPQG